jgi:hypothetical protein
MSAACFSLEGFLWRRQKYSMAAPATMIRNTAHPMPMPAARTTLLVEEDLESSAEVGVVALATTDSLVVFGLAVDVVDEFVVVMIEEDVANDEVTPGDAGEDELEPDVDVDDIVVDDVDVAEVVSVDGAFEDVVEAVRAACADATEAAELEYFATNGKSAIQKYPAQTPPCNWSSSEPSAFVK